MSKLDQIRALGRAKYEARKTSAGGVEADTQRARQLSGALGSPELSGFSSGMAPANEAGRIAGVAPGPAETKHGRPRIGETRDKPWITAGMSRRTWYRRKAEARK